jgi:hypothetical protein
VVFFKIELGIEEGSFSYLPGKDNLIPVHFVELDEDLMVLRIHVFTHDLHEWIRQQAR